jgi:heme/copper-type cytochrome/quinol oxidase subunit 2
LLLLLCFHFFLSFKNIITPQQKNPIFPTLEILSQKTQFKYFPFNLKKRRKEKKNVSFYVYNAMCMYAYIYIYISIVVVLVVFFRRDKNRKCGASLERDLQRHILLNYKEG